MADQVVADLAAADRAVVGRVATDPPLIDLGPVATDRHLIVPAREAIGQRSTDPAAKATVRLSIARARPPTGHHSIARGATARHRLIARGVTIGRLEMARGKLIGRHMTVRGANFDPSQIALAEILARPRSAHGPRALRATGRGRTDHAVTLGRHSTPAVAVEAPAAVAVGPTRIVRGDLGPMDDVTGRRATRAERRARSTPARRGQQTSTRASSWVKGTS